MRFEKPPQNKDIEFFIAFKKFSGHPCLLSLVPGNHGGNFCTYRFALSEYRIHGLKQYVAFWVWLLSLSIMVWFCFFEESNFILK